MTEEQQPDETPEQPADEQPEDDGSDAEAAEQPTEGEPAAADPPAAEEQPAAENEATASDQPDAEEQPAAAEAAETEQPTEPEASDAPSAADQPSEPATPAAEQPKAKDLPPGAELEPIAIEPERELSAEERAAREAEEEERLRLEAAAEVTDEPLSRSGGPVAIAADARIQATGKRKSSIARVIVRPGNGTLVINGRTLDEYFPRAALRTIARQPLLTAGYEGTVDVQVRVHGGGISGQAGAVRHGIARALCEIDPELRPELKRRGLLTRDARKKERRKAGFKKARKRPQFSKR